MDQKIDTNRASTSIFSGLSFELDIFAITSVFEEEPFGINDIIEKLLQFERIQAMSDKIK